MLTAFFRNGGSSFEGMIKSKQITLTELSIDRVVFFKNSIINYYIILKIYLFVLNDNLM